MTSKLLFQTSLILSLIFFFAPLPFDSEAPVIPNTDKIFHGIIFCWLGLIFRLAYPNIGKYTASLILFSYAVLIEIIQKYLPYRSFESADIVADSIGIIIAFIVLLLPFTNSRPQSNHSSTNTKK